MTSSASLMLLLGAQLLGYAMPATVADTAKTLLENFDGKLPTLLGGRSHFVFLGGGALYGIALEAAADDAMLTVQATNLLRALFVRAKLL